MCAQASNLKELYKGTRHDGLGPEVKRRILMGTYALSAGFYDAYYKRAQQVSTQYHRVLLTFCAAVCVAGRLFTLCSAFADL